MKIVRRCLAHLLIAMLLSLAVLVVLDGYNPSMGFLNSDMTKIFYLALCAVGLFIAVSQAWRES